MCICPSGIYLFQLWYVSKHHSEIIQNVFKKVFACLGEFSSHSENVESAQNF